MHVQLHCQTQQVIKTWPAAYLLCYRIEGLLRNTALLFGFYVSNQKCSLFRIAVLELRWESKTCDY